MENKINPLNLNKLLFTAAMFVLITAATFSINAQEGFVNPDIDLRVNDMSLQPGGKIIIGGDFRNVGGQPRAKVARLNPNGSLDASFSDPNITGDVFNLRVLTVAVQNDGKVVIGGLFTAVGGISKPHLSRLNADGSLDTTFSPSPDSTVTSVELQTDGKILVSGYFTNIGGQNRHRLARLNPDGSVDQTFQDANINAIPGTIAVQPDGKILIGGNFTSVGGQPRPGSARLNADGTLDAAFNPNVGGSPTEFVFQPDGKIIVSGFFQNVGGQPRTSVARINGDGSLDESFQNPQIGSGNVTALALQTDGKIVIGGEFSVIAGQERRDIARLNADGSLDSTFLDPNTNFGGTFYSITKIIVQPDRKILIGGDFMTIGRQTRRMVVRLIDNGKLDLPPAQIFTVSKTADSNDGNCDADCSLREAVSAAGANVNPSQITFDNQIFSSAQTITLSSGELILEENRRILITGPGASLLTVSGGNTSRVWRLKRDAAIKISGLTITGGNGAGGMGGGNGGGIYIEPNGVATELTLDAVTMTGNQTGTGGAIATLGGSVLTITNSVISNNTATYSPGGGGIHFDRGTLNISNCNFSGNAATFANGSGGGAINLVGSDVLMNISNSIITGNTANYAAGIVANGTTNISGTTISNNRAVNSAGGIAASGNVVVTNSFITGNSVTDTDGIGGGITNFGRLSISNSTVRLNSGDFGGAIYAAGGLTVSDSEISQNSAGKGGGAIYNNSGGTNSLPVIIERSRILNNSSGGGGGGIYNRDMVNLSDSTVQGNFSRTAGGGIYNIFLNVGAAAVNITGSTISSNRSDAGGGGIANQQGTVKLFNSSVSSNNARGLGSGIDNYVSGTVNLSSATVAFNSSVATSGAGINNSSNSTVNSRNTIIARNTAANSARFADFAGTLNSSGYNLIGTTNGTMFTGVGTGNLLNFDPRLAPLSNNGGRTLTHALRSGSPAIDSGDSADLTVDQRGRLRPVDFSQIPNTANAADIGAFEKQSDDLTLSTAAFDYDGDSRSDVSVFRPAAGSWYLSRSTAGFASAAFGVSTDKIVPADYDGDGKTDVAVFRDGNWYSLRSSDGIFSAVGFGQTGDVPQTGDFDGDGRADQAVYRDGNWYLNRSTTGFSATSFGISTDKPVASDYDGDGKTDIGVYRDGNWYSLRSSDGAFAAVAFGQAGDIPVAADYDGDGRTDQAVYRSGVWYLNRSTSGFSAVSFGLSTDKPVPADYDGDGRADVAVYRDGNWYLLQSSSGFTAQFFGQTGDLPTPGAFIP